MNWQLVLLLNLVIYAIAQILIKLIVSKLPRAQALSLQFLICACLIFLYWVLIDKSELSLSTFLLVGTVGFVNAWGAYCQWRAIKLSLSKTSLFSPLSDLLTVVLAVLFLNEITKWNIYLIAGIVLSFGAVYLFLTGRKVEKEDNAKEWIVFTAGMVIIFGTVTFMMKVFSFDIPRSQFLMFWYGGAFLGSLPILYLEKQNPLRFPGKLVFLVPLASLAILGSLATVYWAFQLTEASKVIPFRAVGITFLPVLIGWFIFKERKGLSKRGIVAFVVGIVGALLIILS